MRRLPALLVPVPFILAALLLVALFLCPSAAPGQSGSAGRAATVDAAPAADRPVLPPLPADPSPLQESLLLGGSPLPLPVAMPMRVTAPAASSPAVALRMRSAADVIASLPARELLFEDEYLALKVDPAAATITRVTPEPALSPEALQALDLAPLWVRDALRLKFRLLAARQLDDEFASLILTAADNLKDEVAFTVAHLSVASLTNSLFAQDRAMIVRNAEMIYRVADSLHYVRLVEHGSLAARDYATTTSYRVYDPAVSDTVWKELPREYYYWYIVHPKLHQESVLVRDNGSDASGQRTYGFSWRDFIWNNPSTQRDYTQVNISTSKGTVATIPRFGELMQAPRYLWDRNKTYRMFGRAFAPGQSALDVLGNWASRAVPVNVTLPRAFQPNQILIKHNGMCNEDAFLTAAACRTALIPIVYLGCHAEDHVFGMVWDGDWNHYEFFRGGLEPSGNQYYGITNMLDGGSYGWKISMVEAMRPDGCPMNFTKYYTNTCTVQLQVTDTLGAPMEGAMVQLFAPYGSGYAQCAHFFTGSSGMLEFEAGEAKRYLVNVYHPLYGWSPQDSTRAYYLTAANTVAGQRYTVTVPFPNVRRTPESVPLAPLPGTADKALRVVLDSGREVVSGINTGDGQRSRFYAWQDAPGSSLSISLMDETNYNAFTQHRSYTCFDHRTYASTWGANIPSNQPFYVVLRNRAPANVLEQVAITCELLGAPISSADAPRAAGAEVDVYPQPASTHCVFSSPRPLREIEIFDAIGRRAALLTGTDTWIPARGTRPGLYIARIRTDAGTVVRSIVLAGR